jgi:hypothetical protein
MARVDTDGYRDDLPRVDPAPPGRTTLSPTVYVVDDDAGLASTVPTRASGPPPTAIRDGHPDAGPLIGFSVRF